MKRISTKLTLLIVFIILVSSLLSVIISTIFGYSFRKEIKNNQLAMMHAAIFLIEEHNLGIEDVHETLTNTVFLMTSDPEISAFDISEEKQDLLEKEGFYYTQGSWYHLPYTMFKAGGYYFKISFDGNATIMKTISSRMGLTVLSYVVVGIFLTVLAVRPMVQPLLKLTQATKEVAKGNFDVQVQSKGNDEIKMLTDHFNQMTRELKNIEFLRKDFISNFSHEFKTPIASIQGFAKLLGQASISAEDQKEYAAIIVEETQRLSHLGNNILKLSKLENQEIITRHQSFSLDEQMRRCILLLEKEWSDKNLSLNLELEPVLVKGDEGLLSQVWLNLIENAIKFSKEDTELNISLAKNQNQGIITMTDQGVGMTEETQKRIFEQFYQGDHDHSQLGNGLGLALVKKIIDLHHGQISVFSQVNKGTTFQINLPLG